MSSFSAWIGRTQSQTDVLDPARSNALSAALGEDRILRVGDPLPLLHHWLYFWDVRAPLRLGTDGHPAKGDFLPPVPLPRRMWAGGRLTFTAPLRLGAEVTRTSTILDVTEKTGGTGPLVFVVVRHELNAGEGVAIIEEQDLVYRAPAKVVPAPATPDAAAEAAPEAAWVERVDPDSVLLFRYSALTMNSHRIHYDRSYAIEDEGYPALVVHGPLQATLLLRLAERNLSDPVTAFRFRGLRPAFDGAALNLCGVSTERGADVWTEQGDIRTMVATVSTGSTAS